MTTLGVTLERWAAWAPGLETESDWWQWAQTSAPIPRDGSPDVSFLPSMFRRRLSRLSKMALRSAHDCLQNDKPVRTVFCSRHGELSRTSALLESIIAGEPLSPTAFSMSVHNTASGLYSIANNDRSPSSAVAAGEDTFESAFLDAAAFLRLNPDEKVLLIASEEPPPAVFDTLVTEDTPPYSAAFLLVACSGGRTLRLSIDADGQELESGREPHALALLRSLLKRETCLRLTGPRLNWVWETAA